jgi:hypothetical protein
MSGGEGFLGRWSRLKRDGEKATDAAPTSLVVEPAAPDAAETPPVAAEPPEAEFDVTTLPSIEDLTANSDFSQFLQKGVPEALKNAALRRMWTLDPILSAPDRFAEYAWDFNDPNAMIGFGPLEPGFDPSTMLRQIMGETEPKPAGDSAGDAVTQVAEPNQPDPEAETEEQVASEPGLGEPLVESEPGQIVATEPAGVNDDFVGARQAPETPEFQPVRRRHGGALPNYE